MKLPGVSVGYLIEKWWRTPQGAKKLGKWVIKCSQHVRFAYVWVSQLLEYICNYILANVCVRERNTFRLLTSRMTSTSKFSTLLTPPVQCIHVHHLFNMTNILIG